MCDPDGHKTEAAFWIWTSPKVAVAYVGIE
jgi:hypothetical protein